MVELFLTMREKGKAVIHTMEKFIKNGLFVLLVHLRRISFIPFVLSWFFKLPSFCVVAYAVTIIVSFVFVLLTDQYSHSLVEWVLMWDIGSLITYYCGANKGARLWNIWHYRNYKEQKTADEKAKSILLRLAVLAFVLFFLLTLAHYFLPNFYNKIVEIICCFLSFW